MGSLLSAHDIRYHALTINIHIKRKKSYTGGTKKTGHQHEKRERVDGL